MPGNCLANSICISDLTASTLANLVIAAFTVALVGLQIFKNRHEKSVARANYKLSLYEKRMEVYLRIDSFLQDTVRNGKPSIEKSWELRYNLRLAHFLFPKKPLEYVEMLHKNAVKWKEQELTWEPLRQRMVTEDPTVTDEERVKAQAALDSMQEIQVWFLAQLAEERLPREFEPYLRLPPSV